MRQVAFVAAALAFTGSAYAADLPIKAPPMVAPVFSWTGFYFGGNLGWGWAHSSFCTDATIANCTIAPVDVVSPNGNNFVGGVQTGARYQFNNIVIGFESMYDATDISASSPGIVPGFPGRVRSTTFDNLFSTTGQLGFAWDRWLAYGKGGWARTRVEFSANNTLPGGLSLNASKHTDGWTAGGGVEYAMTNYVSVGVEYDYYRFNDIGNILNITNSGGVLIPCAFCAHGNDNVQTVTARINVKLDALGLPFFK